MESDLGKSLRVVMQEGFRISGVAILKDGWPNSKAPKSLTLKVIPPASESSKFWAGVTSNIRGLGPR